MYQPESRDALPRCMKLTSDLASGSAQSLKTTFMVELTFILRQFLSIERSGRSLQPQMRALSAPGDIDAPPIQADHAAFGTATPRTVTAK